MSDDISIPYSGPTRTAYTHSYRARRNGIDAGTRVLMITAAGLGLMLAVGMGVWTLSGRHPAAGVPTIAADTSPLRIRPANPGGMTLAGLSDIGAPGTSGPSDLAPIAEIPDPQALRAQRESLAAPAEPTAPSPPLTAMPAVPMPAVVPIPAVALAHSAAGATATPALATAAARPAPALLVQLAAVDSEKAANAEWQRLAKKMPDLLADRQLTAEKIQLSGKTLWRVRTAGFNDVAEATQFCQRVRAKGVGCSLANF